MGSTQVLIEALSPARDPLLLSVESDAMRYVQLVENVKQHTWVKPVFGSSITLSSLTPKSFEDVWGSRHNRLCYPEKLVRGWWQQCLDDLALVQSGVLELLSELQFDVVLIDGSEFTGYDDFRLTRDNAKCLMLDDVHFAYKCNQAHCELMSDPAWSLEWEDATVRNGASIWVRR
jgi:hypothetical protein